MPPEIVDFFSQLGKITGDESVGRGIVTSIGAVAVVMATGWRLLRRAKPERVRVNIDAPHGERVVVRVGKKKVQ